MNDALQNIPENCEDCSCKLSIWKHKTPKSYLLSLGAMRKVDIPVQFCPSCSCAYYPELYLHGIIFLHNKLMISVGLLLDLINVLKTGSSMIETIENRVKLLGSMAGLKNDEINTNLSNISIKMEKATIALASVLIGVEDLDLVTCYHISVYLNHFSEAVIQTY